MVVLERGSLTRRLFLFCLDILIKGAKLLIMFGSQMLVKNVIKKKRWCFCMNDKKEVYFDAYCKKCKYSKTEEFKDPCNDCLDNPYNINSHKPVNYDEEQN